MPSNLELWDSVKVTDPRATKPYNNGRFKGTDINPVWLARQATEQFGPVGHGWGWVIKDDRLDRVGDETYHVLRVLLWWKGSGDQRNEYECFGCTRIAGKDEDYAKKSLTDAIKKGLSYLGFSADVFMGLFDTAGYQDRALQHHKKKANGGNDNGK